MIAIQMPAHFVLPIPANHAHLIKTSYGYLGILTDAMRQAISNLYFGVSCCLSVLYYVIHVPKKSLGGIEWNLSPGSDSFAYESLFF